MFLCGGNIASAAQEQPNVQQTLHSVFNAIVSIPEAVLVNEFSSGENAGVVYYVIRVLCAVCAARLMLPCRLFVQPSGTSHGSFAAAIATSPNCNARWRFIPHSHILLPVSC